MPRNYYSSCGRRERRKGESWAGLPWTQLTASVASSPAGGHDMGQGFTSPNQRSPGHSNYFLPPTQSTMQDGSMPSSHAWGGDKRLRPDLGFPALTNLQPHYIDPAVLFRDNSLLLLLPDKASPITQVLQYGKVRAQALMMSESGYNSVTEGTDFVTSLTSPGVGLPEQQLLAPDQDRLQVNFCLLPTTCLW